MKNYKYIVFSVSFIAIFSIFNTVEATTVSKIQPLIDHFIQRETSEKGINHADFNKDNNKFNQDSDFKCGKKLPICLKIAISAKNPTTGECKKFPTSCDVPSGWIKVISCPVIKPFITVLSPNGGEQWETGKTYDITWQAEGIKNSFEIYIKDNKATSTYTLIASGISSSLRSYSWNVPNITGDKFKIQIKETGGTGCKESNKGVSDESDNYFSITVPNIPVPSAPSMRIISPNGEEQWEIGKTYQVSWNLSGFDLWDINYQGIQIQLWDSSGSAHIGTFCIMCASSAQGGSYDWTIGQVFAPNGYVNIQPGQYTIRISVVSNTSIPNDYYRIDFSDAPFNIIAPITPGE